MQNAFSGDMKFKQNKFLPPDKQILTANPDINIVELCDDDEFIVLACDGIWDCMSSQQLVDFIREHIDTVSTKQFNTICPFENCKHHLRITFGLSLAIAHADVVLAICFLETE
uniref:protein-serine/threonine phosphatase n=1 Tax=Zea mays TaxID=4577 RepID=A0A804Q581_MAIZE